MQWGNQIIPTMEQSCDTTNVNTRNHLPNQSAALTFSGCLRHHLGLNRMFSQARNGLWHSLDLKTGWHWTRTADRADSFKKQIVPFQFFWSVFHDNRHTPPINLLLRNTTHKTDVWSVLLTDRFYQSDAAQPAPSFVILRSHVNSVSFGYHTCHNCRHSRQPKEHSSVNQKASLFLSAHGRFPEYAQTTFDLRRWATGPNNPWNLIRQWSNGAFPSDCYKRWPHSYNSFHFNLYSI